MPHADEADLFAELMNFIAKSPQQLLRELLEEKGLRNVDLGKMLGLRNPSLAVTGMLADDKPGKPRRFGAPRQRKVAKLFGLPPDYFTSATIGAKLDAHRRSMWRQFTESPVAALLSPEQGEIVKWICDEAPLRKPYLNASFLKAVALALLDPDRYTSEELVFAAQENEELSDREVESIAAPGREKKSRPSRRGNTRQLQKKATARR